MNELQGPALELVLTARPIHLKQSTHPVDLQAPRELQLATTLVCNAQS